MTLRREIRDVPISSMMDSSVTDAPFQAEARARASAQVGR
jgi:hypothetical protein